MYKVLLVDDESIIVEGLSRSIPWERWNCRVVATANDGTEGKNLIEKERPDIVFMDICMPEMNGLQMIAALNSQFPDLEVSVLTGYRDFEYAKEAIRLGVTRFLLKPSNMDELEEAIECMCANLNLAHFSRVFKKQVGVSANEYRNRDFALKNKNPCSACEFQAKQGISIWGIKLLFFSV